MFSLLIILILQIHGGLNYHNSCGCNIGRLQGTNSKKAQVFGQFYNADSVQCPTEKAEYVYTKESRYRGKTDMILVPGGEYQIGTDEVIIESDKEGPKKIVKLNTFYLDKYEVSNEDFEKFVHDTDYKTEAEVFGDSFVFTLFLNSSFRDILKDYRVAQAPWWYKVNGSDWKHPYGPDSNIKDAIDHPVIHVSWRDSRAYCAWRDARLPTEAEWEAACRGSSRDTNFPWGDKLFPDHKHMANIWQGTFPNHNSKKDGFIGTNPVHLFSQNELGFHNLAGNVWEWTEDEWSSTEPNEKVKKGGSYLCHKSYCYRYRCSARSHNTEDSTAGNLGFRCARTP